MSPDKETVIHTPYAHNHHNDGVRCDCAENLKDAAFVCKCGAAYTVDVYDFLRFVCYDCHRELHKNYIREYKKPENNEIPT